MATADLIQKMNDKLLDIYDAIERKGGTAPEQKNLDNVAAAVGTITGGERPPLPEYPYPVEEFDGGEYGAIAYLRDDKVHYYTATSASDLVTKQSTISISGAWKIKTLDDGFVINSSNILAYAVGSTATNIPQYTLVQCPLLQNFYWNKNAKLSFIGSYFLYGCTAFNQPLDIPEGITEIGSDVLQGCSAFNQPITFPSSLLKISPHFLRSCSSFNQPLIIPDSVYEIGSYFLYNCTSFNQRLFLPDTVYSLGQDFLAGCSSFDQPLDIPAGITSIAVDFMSQCSSFNSPLTFRGNITSIGGAFLFNNTLFNQELSFPNATAVNGSFLNSCINFNQKISLPNVTTVGNNFLDGATAFNQELELPRLTRIGDYFMRGATSFQHPFTIPDTVTSVGTYFMYNCNNFTGPLNVGKASGGTGGNQYLATQTATAPMYTEGVTLVGENAEAWMMMLPNRDSSPYRKLINGNA